MSASTETTKMTETKTQKTFDLDYVARLPKAQVVFQAVMKKLKEDDVDRICEYMPKRQPDPVRLNQEGKPTSNQSWIFGSIDGYIYAASAIYDRVVEAVELLEAKK